MIIRVIKTCKLHLLLVTIIIFASCSTQKNTGPRRFFHNLTSKYNILFNGEQSYLEGMEKLQTDFPDNYSKILSVFLYDNKDNVAGISGNMNRTIEKSTKLITKHSITIKPEFDPEKPMTEKQREFYNQYEFNKWADESYLYMGKAQLHLHEFDKASQSFTYLITNFQHTLASKKARIWQARLALLAGRYRETEGILLEMEEEQPEIYEKLNYLVEPTWADLYLKQNKYEEAVAHLEKSYAAANDKYYRTRYAFITAQVFQELENYTKANEYYEYAIKLNPPYEMTFNAKINMALSYETGAGSRREIEGRLKKMLKDDKNIDYQDQIYYALGNIAYVENELQLAIEYYEKSIEVSKGNTNQLTLSNLTLADIYYDQPDYFKAQARYDSTLSLINPDYPNYTLIYNKSTSLTSLVENLNTIHFNDSVLLLAELPEDELLNKIDLLIEENIRLEEEQKERELEKMSEESFSQAAFDQAGDTKWYFYSSSTVQKGRTDFKRKWGNRKLEDNWRRTNKTVIEYEIDDQSSLADNNIDTLQLPGADDFRNREYYLKDIPFTDEEKETALEEISNALYMAGSIYYSDLKDYQRATETFEELIKRYPDFENRLSVYYDLYIIGRETPDAALENKYKNKIIAEFPNSVYARALSDPDYMSVVNAKEQTVIVAYEKVLKLYEKGKYNDVYIESKKAMEKYPEHERFAYFEYLNLITSSERFNSEEFIKSLEKFKTSHPKHELLQNIDMLIAYNKSDKPGAVEKIKTEEPKEIYELNTATTHMILLTLPIKSNSNQLTFNILGYNVDNNPELNLKTKKAQLNNDIMLVTISSFKNGKEAKEYADKLEKFPDLWKDIDADNTTFSIISTDNYSKLLKNKEITSYIFFYKDNY